MHESDSFIRKREAYRQYIRLIIKRLNLKNATQLARKIGIAPSTLNRFLNNDVSHLLSIGTLTDLSNLSKIPIPIVEGEEYSNEHKEIVRQLSKEECKPEIPYRLPYKSIKAAFDIAENIIKRETNFSQERVDELAEKMCRVAEAVGFDIINEHLAWWVLSQEDDF